MTMELLSYKFQFFDEEPLLDMNDKPTFGNAIGAVKYTFKINIEGRDEDYEHIIYQPFGEDTSTQFYEDSGASFLVWGWDKNRENPTLNPSFLYDTPPAGKLHLFVKHGNIEILPDTTMKHDKVKRL